MQKNTETSPNFSPRDIKLWTSNTLAVHKSKAAGVSFYFIFSGKTLVGVFLINYVSQSAAATFHSNFCLQYSALSLSILFPLFPLTYSAKSWGWPTTRRQPASPPASRFLPPTFPRRKRPLSASEDLCRFLLVKYWKSWEWLRRGGGGAIFVKYWA